MRAQAPFRADDLADLDLLYERAIAVVAMEDVADGVTDHRMVGVRHDVDNYLAPAVAMAEWEAERGYRSTYFILDSAPYWQEKDTLRAGLEVIAECGHEIGYHCNAIATSIRTGRDARAIIADGVGELRSYGHTIRGVVAHGDPLCYGENGQVRFVNDEVFTESARPSSGAPDRRVGETAVTLLPVSRTEFGFDYDPNWLPREQYLSDSGGRWSQPFEQVAGGFPYDGQLHVLIHACWWAEAFVPAEVAA